MSPSFVNIRLFIAFLFALILISCSKSTQQDPDPIPDKKSCLIISSVTVSSTNTDTARVTYKYNTEGKIIEQTYSYSPLETFTNHYIYSGNRIFKAIDAGIHSYVDTITLNDWGHVDSLKEVSPQGTFYARWKYNSAHELIQYISWSDPMYNGVYNYTNTNGDMTESSVVGGDTTAWVYDLDKPTVQGSQDDIQRLEWGAPINTNKHLLIKLDGGHDHHTYSYTFTPEGNVATMTSNINSYHGVTTFTYECK